MKKQEIRNMILEEATYIKNLLNEKKSIEKQLSKVLNEEFPPMGMEDGPFSEPEDLERLDRETQYDITPEKDTYTKEELKQWFEEDPEGLLSFIQGESDEEFGGEFDEELDEMMGVGNVPSRRAGAETTNPIYKSREERGYVNEEKNLRKAIRNQLYESYKIK